MKFKEWLKIIENAFSSSAVAGVPIRLFGGTREFADFTKKKKTSLLTVDDLEKNKFPK